MAGLGPYRMHIYRSAAAIATSSWPGFPGPPIPARAATDGPDKPGNDDGETLAAIEQTFDFMAVSEMCASLLQLSFFVFKSDRGCVLSSGRFWQRPDACAARWTNRR